MEQAKTRISKKQLQTIIDSIADTKDWDSGIKGDMSKI